MTLARWGFDNRVNSRGIHLAILLNFKPLPLNITIPFVRTAYFRNSIVTFAVSKGGLTLSLRPFRVDLNIIVLFCPSCQVSHFSLTTRQRYKDFY